MRVGVCDRHQPGLEGAHSLTERTKPDGTAIPPVDAIFVADLHEALFQEWDFDAHFTSYQVEGEDRFPRINKSALPWLASQGSAVTCSYLGIDIDNNPHRPWAEAGLGKRQQLLERICEIPDDVLIQFRYLYFSSKGARLIYELARPVDVDRAEDHLRWLTDRWIRNGFDDGCDWKVDRLCDWTRLFRLPKVMREGKQTSKARYFSEPFDQQVAVDPDHIGRIDLASHGLSNRAVASPVDEDMPEPEECHDMMWTGAKMSDWHRQAKKALKGRECFPYLFEEESLRVDRDLALTRFIGQVCGLLFPMEQCTARRIYALFYELVATLEPDSGTPDWFNSAWGKIKRFYGKELTVRTEKAVVEAEEQLATEISLGEQLVNGVRSWSSAKEARAVFSDTGQALKYLSRRMVANCGSIYMVMGPDGRYENLPLKKDQLIPRIRVSGIEPYVPTTRYTDDGEKDILPAVIVNRHCTIVRDIEGIAGSRPGGWIKDMDTPEATMFMSLYCLNPRLNPCFDEEVDTWLHVLFGAKYELAEQWIAHALAFDEGPICALSITGDPGAGKKMFTEGLAETLLKPALATSEDLVGDWGYGLFKSPYLVINEGWPKRTRYAKAPMDAFRQAVGGDGLPACRKSEAPVNIRVPLRVIFTANNLDAVKELAHGKTMAPEDRRAIEDRLIHIDVGGRASEWLEAKGGRDFTAAPGRRWIRSDASGESNYIIAQHFLWLYENRRKHNGGRFLLSGERDSQIMQEMRQESGLLPVVAEVMLGMISNYNFDRPLEVTSTAPGMAGICIERERGKVWFTSGGIQQFYFASAQAAATRENLTTNEIGVALRTLAVNRAENSFIPMRGARKSRWHEADIHLLAEMVETYGWACEPLMDLVDNRRIEENSFTVERIIDA